MMNRIKLNVILTKTSVTKDDTLLKWWNKYPLIFIQFAVLANSIVGVSANSATSEHVFSSSGRVTDLHNCWFVK
jgi:hypothetical protein